LDIFCNARTLICSNSTRCLKVYEVFFDSKEQRVLGGESKVIGKDYSVNVCVLFI
jgi:hypothetical protein